MPTELSLTIKLDPAHAPTQLAYLQQIMDLLLKIEKPAPVSLAPAAPIPSPTAEAPKRSPGRPRKNGDAQPAPDPQSTVKVTTKAPPPPPPPIDDLAGDDAFAAQDEADDGMDGMMNSAGDGASLSAEEALNFAMGGIRNAYYAGHKQPIAELRKKWGVANFQEIGPNHGHQLYKEVSVILEKAGMHI